MLAFRRIIAIAVLTSMTFTAGCRSDGYDATSDETNAAEELALKVNVALVNASSDGSSYRYDQFCGGVLGAPGQVITAEHCVKDRSADSIAVIVGLDDLCEPELTAIRLNVTSVTHRVDEGGHLAMLELDREASLPQLPVDLGPANPGDSAVAVGWGRDQPMGSAPCELGAKRLTVVEPERCMQGRFAPLDAATIVCAVPAQSRNSCDGDSGGPVVIFRGDQFVRAAVTVAGWGCGPDALGINLALPKAAAY